MYTGGDKKVHIFRHILNSLKKMNFDFCYFFLKFTWNGGYKCRCFHNDKEKSANKIIWILNIPGKSLRDERESRWEIWFGRGLELN